MEFSKDNTSFTFQLPNKVERLSSLSFYIKQLNKHRIHNCDSFSFFLNRSFSFQESQTFYFRWMRKLAREFSIICTGWDIYIWGHYVNSKFKGISLFYGQCQNDARTTMEQGNFYQWRSLFLSFIIYDLPTSPLSFSFFALLFLQWARSI